MKELGVLVVDDDSEILAVIERMLGHFEVNVDCVTCAIEALKLLRTKKYTTMITDLEMPGMDGLELAREARKLNPDLDIVLFTGNTSEQVMNLIFTPQVSDISEVHSKPSGLCEMLMGIMKRGSGRTFLLDGSKPR